MPSDFLSHFDHLVKMSYDPVQPHTIDIAGSLLWEAGLSMDS